jgi:hypothetical protein
MLDIHTYYDDETVNAVFVGGRAVFIDGKADGPRR